MNGKVGLAFHTVLSGIIAFLLSIFFASGALGENYTDHIFVSPGFLLIIVFWLVGIVLLFLGKRRPAIMIMWCAIPAGYVIGLLLSVFD